MDEPWISALRLTDACHRLETVKFISILALPSALISVNDAHEIENDTRLQIVDMAQEFSLKRVAVK